MDGIVTSDEQFDRILAHALKKDEIEMEKKQRKRKKENRQKKIRKKRRNTKGIKTSVIK